MAKLGIGGLGGGRTSEQNQRVIGIVRDSTLQIISKPYRFGSLTVSAPLSTEAGR